MAITSAKKHAIKQFNGTPLDKIKKCGNTNNHKTMAITSANKGYNISLMVTTSPSIRKIISNMAITSANKKNTSCNKMAYGNNICQNHHKCQYKWL